MKKSYNCILSSSKSSLKNKDQGKQIEHRVKDILSLQLKLLNKYCKRKIIKYALKLLAAKQSKQKYKFYLDYLGK